MSSATRRNAAAEIARKSSFDVYRDGGVTREIRLTINMVIVARRWRSLLDDRLRMVGQSSARMEALAAEKGTANV